MITMIAAVASNGVIGNSKLSGMPWHCSEELKFFKRETMGSTLIMGRTTAEQVGKLPGRDAIVLSRDSNYTLEGFTTFSMEQFLFEYDKNPEKKYMVCGGGEIYNLFMPYLNGSIISYMNFSVDGDIFLPDILMQDGNYCHMVDEIEHDEFTIRKRKFNRYQ